MMHSSGSHHYHVTQIQKLGSVGRSTPISQSVIAVLNFHNLANLFCLMPRSRPYASMVGPHKRVDHDSGRFSVAFDAYGWQMRAKT
ncbi:hypothetical protein [Thalassoglobus sp.]|uniref:hypothetical protein n=1 Tax=Thalassoglobus sp. TaxID=2795869 RepID=UPI003AA98915